MSSKQLEFVPITSLINPSFWNKLSEIKLNDDKLDEKEHPVWGFFSNINNKCNIPILEVNSTSFNREFESQRIYIPFHGKILNVNTIESFKGCDKTQCINKIGQELFKNIENGSALKMPSILNQFYILSYADLKKFNFYYWFAFPVPYNLSITYNSVKNIYDDFAKDQLEHIWERYCEMENSQKPYFIVSRDNGEVNVFRLKDKLKFIDGENFNYFYFAFYDLSLLENCPGSTFRNYIMLILQYCPDLQQKSVNFLSFRIKRNEDYKLTISNSLIFNIELPHCGTSVFDFINQDPEKRWVGWEKNERGKLGPRLSNMKSFLDPKELAESSVDLNLKLMKWRLLSNIDLEKVKVTKFLLLGAGTLGCSVARILLGWGARNITFVDNSTVSYSNPVRQSLFTFEDSQNSKPKAFAAAENLRKIFPGVKTNSYQITIPMPGHPVGDSMMEQVKKDVELLTKVVSQHDVIFLLMDSRESRWFPTLLGSYFSKTVINAALGFDSYLVMRHGVRMDIDEFKVRQHPTGFKSLKGNFLGCYFCNDVTAPGNSTKDRTLDQQCTVTRPGVSAIAGALAAELAISLLQHKEGPKAPAFYQLGNAKQQELDNQCVLGILPHSIRGYLSTFSQVLPAVERYQQCIACSPAILHAYHKDGFNFLLEVFQNSKYLEDISGVAKMNKEAEDTTIWEFSDEEEIQCTDYEDNDSDSAKASEGTCRDENVKHHEENENSELVAFQTESLQEVVADLLETIVENVEKNNYDTELMRVKSEESISNTEDIEKILPDDIIDIVKRLKDQKSVNSISQKEEESPISMHILQDNRKSNNLDSFSETLTETFSQGSVYSEFLPTTDVTLVNERFISSTSSIFHSVSGFNDLNVPKELLPVLEKQYSRRSLFYSSRTLSNDKPSVNINMQEISPFQAYSRAEKNENKGIAEKKKSFGSLMTLMSLVKDFGSSTSSQTIVNSDCDKSKSSLTGKIRNFFVAKNIKTSSESLSQDDSLNEKIDDVITITKPRTIFSSGSLTSDGLAADESVYYLAETGSEKIKKI